MPENINVLCMLAPPFLGRYTGDLFESSAEIAVIIESAFFTYLRNGVVAFEQLLGVGDFFCQNESLDWNAHLL